MSLFKFTKTIIESKQLQLFNKGNHIRDFTFIDDVVESISRLLMKKSKSKIPYQVFNVSSSSPKHLRLFLKKIEKNICKKAKIKLRNMQQGDIRKTHGSNSKLKNKIGFIPTTALDKGIIKFISWYKSYYKI